MALAKCRGRGAAGKLLFSLCHLYRQRRASLPTLFHNKHCSNTWKFKGDLAHFFQFSMFSLSSKTISIFLMACSGTEATGPFQQKASPGHRLMKVGRGRSFPLATQASTCLPVLLKSHIWKKSAERDVRTEPHVYNISQFNLSSTLEPSAQLLAASYMS